MMVVVKDKQQRCWNCKQVCHLAKVCPHKAADLLQWPGEAKTTNSTNTTDTNKTTDTTNAAPRGETRNEWTRQHLPDHTSGIRPPKHQWTFTQPEKKKGQWRKPGKNLQRSLTPAPTTTPAISVPRLRTSPPPTRNSSIFTDPSARAGYETVNF